MGVVGPFSDAAVLAAAPTYRELGLPAITPATCASSVASGEGGFFCLGADADLLVEAMLGAVPPGQNAVWIGAHPPGQGVSLLDVDREFARNVVPPESWYEHPADVYLYDGDVLTAADLLVEMRDAGVGEPFLGGPMVARTQLSLIAGPAVNAACHAVTEPLFATQARSWVDGYGELAGIPPGPWAALAYDATLLLLDGIQGAIEESGHPTREGVEAALVDVQGPDGRTVFAEGRRRQAGVGFYCYEAGDGYPGVPRR
jgi:ABC-type branched-subunit amino acid transport system substrate-binding protein